MPPRKLPPDAFEFYFGLGPNRSYRAVADHFGSSKTAVANLATREDWRTRISERERKAQEKVEEKAVEALADLNGRHLKMLRTIQAKALEGLKNLSINTGMDCVRALDMAIKGERLVLGEPTERTANDVEAIIKKEHERWLVRQPSEEAQSAG